MTYCVAMRLNAGLVFLSDSRTNAGMDQISTFRKMTVYEKAGERVLVLLSAGNLAITQAVKQLLASETIEGSDGEPCTIWTARSLFDVARIVGSCVRKVHARDAAALKHHGIDFNCSLIVGGQIAGGKLGLYLIYGQGNFIACGADTPYLQIGELKYGKPILVSAYLIGGLDKLADWPGALAEQAVLHVLVALHEARAHQFRRQHRVGRRRRTVLGGGRQRQGQAQGEDRGS